PQSCHTQALLRTPNERAKGFRVGRFTRSGPGRAAAGGGLESLGRLGDDVAAAGLRSSGENTGERRLVFAADALIGVAEVSANRAGAGYRRPRGACGGVLRPTEATHRTAA